MGQYHPCAHRSISRRVSAHAYAPAQHDPHVGVLCSGDPRTDPCADPRAHARAIARADGFVPLTGTCATVSMHSGPFTSLCVSHSVPLMGSLSAQLKICRGTQECIWLRKHPQTNARTHQSTGTVVPKQRRGAEARSVYVAHTNTPTHTPTRTNTRPHARTLARSPHARTHTSTHAHTHARTHA